MQPRRGCSCRQCRRGLHAGGGYAVRRGWRSFRRRTKHALRMGLEPPVTFAIGYTD
jgi:hypothetical protein